MKPAALLPRIRRIHRLGLILIAAAPILADASPALGRLFHTPEKREQLERERNRIRQTSEVAAPDARLTFNGIVIRRDGRRTLWINDARRDETTLPEHIVIAPQDRGAAELRLHPTQRPPLRVPVGDTLNAVSGEITPVLGTGSITRHPPRRSAP